MDSRPARAKVAVVGSGVSGLTAAYLLQRQFDVTLYEADDRFGGHAHTHDVVTPDAGVVPVDTGFIVHNRATYPLLTKLFGELGVTSRPAEMSMSIRCDGCGLEYAGGKGLSGLFAQIGSGANSAFLRMLLEIRRFYRQARLLLSSDDDQLTMRGFLLEGGFSPYFTSHFLVPVVACVWSSAPGVALDSPARYLFTFLDNHGMLSVGGSPAWQTVIGGSKTYVERVVGQLSVAATAAPVRSVQRGANGVEVRNDNDQCALFTKVVLATHAGSALRALARPSAKETSTLGAFSGSCNETWLHSDAAVLPKAPRARSSWNYLLPSCHADPARVLVSYDMNRLQSLPTQTPYIVTLNATDRIEDRLVVDRMVYEHPIYTVDAVAAQHGLAELNDGTIAFAGAYQGWGFHEDGCRSGVAAAASLGVTW